MNSRANELTDTTRSYDGASWPSSKENKLKQLRELVKKKQNLSKQHNGFSFPQSDFSGILQERTFDNVSEGAASEQAEPRPTGNTLEQLMFEGVATEQRGPPWAQPPTGCPKSGLARKWTQILLNRCEKNIRSRRH